MKFVITMDDIIFYGLIILSGLLFVFMAIKLWIVRLIGKIKNRRKNNEERGY